MQTTLPEPIEHNCPALHDYLRKNKIKHPLQCEYCPFCKKKTNPGLDTLDEKC